MENITIALAMIIVLLLAIIWLQRIERKETDMKIAEMNARIVALRILLRQRNKYVEILSKKLIKKNKEVESK